MGWIQPDQWAIEDSEEESCYDSVKKVDENFKRGDKQLGWQSLYLKSRRGQSTSKPTLQHPLSFCLSTYVTGGTKENVGSDRQCAFARRIPAMIHNSQQQIFGSPQKLSYHWELQLHLVPLRFLAGGHVSQCSWGFTSGVWATQYLCGWDACQNRDWAFFQQNPWSLEFLIFSAGHQRSPAFSVTYRSLQETEFPLCMALKLWSHLKHTAYLLISVKLSPEEFYSIQGSDSCECVCGLGAGGGSF